MLAAQKPIDDQIPAGLNTYRIFIQKEYVSYGRYGSYRPEDEKKVRQVLISNGVKMIGAETGPVIKFVSPLSKQDVSSILEKIERTSGILLDEIFPQRGIYSYRLEVPPQDQKKVLAYLKPLEKKIQTTGYPEGNKYVITFTSPLPKTVLDRIIEGWELSGDVTLVEY